MTNDPQDRADQPQSGDSAGSPMEAAQSPSGAAPAPGHAATGPGQHQDQPPHTQPPHAQPPHAQPHNAMRQTEGPQHGNQHGAPPQGGQQHGAPPQGPPHQGRPFYGQPLPPQPGQGPYPRSPHSPQGHPGPHSPQGHPGQHGPHGPSAHPGPQEPRRRRGVGVPLFVTGVLVAGLLGGGVGAGAFGLFAGNDVEVGGSGIEINNPETATAVTAAAAKASPSVATLAVTSGNAAGSGSGIILDDEGHILTNTHVVTLGGVTDEAEISVRLHDGSVRTAEIVGTDPLSDLAVIQLEDPSGLEPADLGTSSDLNVGDQAIAIGAPLGLDGTVTDGIISTLDRTISVASAAVEDEAPDEPTPEDEGEVDQEGDEGDGFEFYFPDMEGSPAQGSIHMNVIQTDAAINQGNSGGALVDSEGQVIGVNVAIASTGGGMAEAEAGSIGVGFSIPIDYAQRVAEDIITDGEVSHGLLGVTVNAAGMEEQPLTPGGGFATGAYIEEVAEGSPAENADLAEGDIITEVDERRIDDSLTLTAIVREYRGGDTVTVTYLRDGEEQQTEVTLGGL